jgi:AcrR family transcriptional regulator
MKAGPKKSTLRRNPKQRRSQQTVEAVLDAVVRILKREGPGAVTTNRIAEVAGVSIGSVYQYFPDKNSIFIALHERHVQEVDRRLQSTLIEHASAPLEVLVRALIQTMVDVHLPDPELFELLLTRVPHHPGPTKAFGTRLQGVIRLAIASRERELNARRNLDRVVFVVTHMIEALTHAAVLHRPPGISLDSAIEEISSAVLVYLREK